MASRVVALKNAVRSGDKDLVVKLLDQGVDPNQFGSHSTNATTPLMVACFHGHLDLIRLLIDRGAEVDLQNGRQETALMKAVSSDIMEQSVMLEVVKLLLQHNAKVHIGYHLDILVMMIACEKGNVELVRLILPHDSWDDPGYVAEVFHKAVDGGHTKIVELLLSSEYINVDNELLASWLHRLSVREDDPEMISLMLDKHPALIDCTCEDFSDRYTALMRASERGRTKIVKMLLERGAKIDYQYQLDSPPEVAGFSALMVAVKSVQTETVELLLEEGAAVDLTDKTGRTALIIACQNGQAELSKMLIVKGANVNHVDCSGGYALLYAVEFAVEGVFYSSNDLRTISQYSDLEYFLLIETLLKRGEKADFVPNYKETAQKVLQENAPSFLRLIESANLKYPKLMALLRPTEHEIDLETTPLPPQTHTLLTVEDKNHESEKMSRKRGRSSSIELSEARAPKTFREDKGVAAIAEATPCPSSEEISPETSSSERSFPDTVPDHPTEINSVPVPKLSDQPCTERRFNLVLYGVQESPQGTNFYDRADKDFENAVAILHNIHSSISNLRIRGCFRIGKYSPKRTRPLLVVFIQAEYVRLILQRLSPDALPSGIAIKPHMSATEMKVESILLRERWKLYTQSGVDKRQIKIRGRKLFIDSRLVGEVVDGEYEHINTS